METELTQGLIRGDPQDRIVKKLAERMGVSRSNAARLVATESAFFAAKGELDNMKELGVEKYQFLATLDRKTSDVCRSMDMKIFPLTDFQPGVTAPPLHCYCRSCTVPYMGDNADGLRAARDEEGKTTYIPDMSYKDWKAVYVDKTKTLDEWAAIRKPEKETNLPKKEVLQKISFIPAKSIEEAQEYAAQFISSFTGSGTPFKGMANYRGISLDMANAVNEALTQVFGTLNLPKLGGIKVVSSKSAQGKKAFPGGDDAIASYNAAGQGIFLNKDVLKNAKAFEVYNQKAKDAWDYVMKNRSRLNKEQQELVKKYEEAGRSLVSGATVQGLVTHELGHHVQWNGFKAKEFNDLTARRKKYDGKISGYAQASSGEYIAESFTAYMKGEKSILDPEFVKALDSKLKQPKKADIIKETGALNDKNDPWGTKRNAHAERYYEFIRNSDRENWVNRVSQSSGIRKASIEKVYDHVFLKKHQLMMGNMRFPADYSMAESFRRLFEGKAIYAHDLIMLKHERLEAELMKRYGYPFAKAHEITERKYNYSEALKRWEKNNHVDR